MKDEYILSNILILLIIFIIVLYIVSSYNKQFIDYKDDNIELIDRRSSKYQTIELVKDKHKNEYCLLLNKRIQNHSGEFKQTHYAMVDISIKLCPIKSNSILILGGGDGYPAMNSLKYKNMYVKNVEIDDTLVEFVKSNPILRQQSNDAFNDTRLHLITEDAYSYIYKEKKVYDIIIHDIELKTNQFISKFNQHDLYIIDNLLTTNGIMNYTQALEDRSEMRFLFDYYLEKKNNVKEPYYIVYIQDLSDFIFLKKYGKELFDVYAFKKKYPNGVIGYMYYDLKYKCGDHNYGEEFYVYICKNEFNKNNNDIKLEKINLQYIYDNDS